MNRVMFTLMGFLLVCFVFSSQVLPQDAVDNQDSLRLEIRELLDKVWEPHDSESASSIDSARNFLDSALSIARQNFGRNDTITATAYNSISKFHLANLEYELSMKFAHKALDILKDSPVRTHIITLNSYDYLVDCCLHLQDLVLCEEYCDKRFEILDNLEKPLTTLEAEQMVMALNDRARLLTLQNRYDEAIIDFENALGLITDEMEEGPRLSAGIRSNIAWILGSRRKWAESKEQLLEVLELAKEVVFPPKDRLVLNTTKMLAGASLQLGEYEQADSLANAAIAIWKEIYGNSKPQDILELQARIRLAQGRDEEAVELATRAVAVNREYTGNYPTNILMGSVETAGNIAMATGNWELANEMFNDLLGLKHTFLNAVFGYASESQKLNYIAKYPPIINTLLSGTTTPSGELLNRTALKMVLQGKSMAIDAVADEQAAAICSLDPRLDSLIEERREVCSRIAGIFGASHGNTDNTSKMLDELYDRKDEIETALSMNCSNMRADNHVDDISPEAVAGRIPNNSVLWEFVRFARIDITKLKYGYNFTGYDYLAMVLTPDSNLTVIDLGEAAIIDSLITEYRNIMSDALQERYSNDSSAQYGPFLEISRLLYKRVIYPLAGTLTDKNKVYIVPDGMLNLLPFGTLTGDGKRYLTEDFELTYLTSGRDLLKEKFGLGRRDAYVVADPDYMVDPSELRPVETSSLLASRGNRETPECLASMFAPLTATRKEGTVVADLLRRSGKYRVTYFEAGEAREGVLESMDLAPDILHIATHGYFCDEVKNPRLSNPLLRSGLILAGANRTIGEMNNNSGNSEDGILTAMEVSVLNLVGTDLVVLSACQTGIGEIQNGEGVFGMRRAFHHAGAKSVIMSMFAVPDESTAELMQRFYDNWLSGQNKSSALRTAVLSILDERRAEGLSTHPLFWGGFILVGDPD